jgi:hypothetical protein
VARRPGVRRHALVHRTAAQMIRTHGGNVLELLLEREFTERELGEDVSADAWFEIAVAAAELLRARPIEERR